MQLTHGQTVYSFEEFKNWLTELWRHQQSFTGHKKEIQIMAYSLINNIIKVLASSNSQYFSGTCVFRILTVRTYGTTFLKK